MRNLQRGGATRGGGVPPARRLDRDTGIVGVSHRAPCRYLVRGLPPLANRSLLNALDREMRFVPKSAREDALQVAWVAFLSGSDPGRAVNTWWQAERRHRRRHEQLADEFPD